MVFPMYVGVIPSDDEKSGKAYGIPHVCGGDPIAVDLSDIIVDVFPMYVGVIPCDRSPCTSDSVYSPCMWG